MLSGGGLRPNAKDGGYVVRLSDPPTTSERLQRSAAAAIAIMPHKCSMDEWTARYGGMTQR